MARKVSFPPCFSIALDEQPVDAIKVIMLKQPNWSSWLINHPSNDASNKNMNPFSNILRSDDLTETKLRSLVEDIDNLF